MIGVYVIAMTILGCLSLAGGLWPVAGRGFGWKNAALGFGSGLLLIGVAAVFGVFE